MLFWIVEKQLKYVENAKEILPQSQNDTVSVDGENSFESAEEQIPVADDKVSSIWTHIWRIKLLFIQVLRIRDNFKGLCIWHFLFFQSTLHFKIINNILTYPLLASFGIQKLLNVGRVRERGGMIRKRNGRLLLLKRSVT